MVKDIVVSVSMITYKHEQYIQQAIEGVLMQQTEFNYELIIADDCSPDSTEEIVNKIIETHPKGYIIKYFRHEKNIGMQANAIFAGKQCKGKYIAVCEGDDYWTGPLKLQQQVDFLDANPEYSFSFHDCTILQQNTKKQTLRIGERQIDETPDLISVIKAKHIPTASLVFRNFDFEKVPNWFFDITNGDYGLVVLLAEQGRGKYFHEPMSVYRVHDGGVWSSQNLEYVYQQDIVFYDHLLNYFEDLEIKNTIIKKVNFVKANYGIFLMRNGEFFKGLLKVMVYNNWIGNNSNKVSYRKVLSSIKEGCQNKIKMI